MPFLYESYTPPHPFSRIKDSEISVAVIAGYPSSSVQVLDATTKKPITDAKVTLYTTEKLTDASGIAVLDAPAGGYSLKISHSQYLSKTLSITLPMAEPLTVTLWPLWSIGLGIAAGATMLTVIIAKVVWRR